MKPVLLALAFCLLCSIAWAQNPIRPPIGQPVLNQGQQARALTKSDTTTLIPTRGLYIGDAAACDIAVVFAGDTAAVTLANVQTGYAYPFSITKLMSTNTTCAAVTALY